MLVKKECACISESVTLEHILLEYGPNIFLFLCKKSPKSLTSTFLDNWKRSFDIELLIFVASMSTMLYQCLRGSSLKSGKSDILSSNPCLALQYNHSEFLVIFFVSSATLCNKYSLDSFRTPPPLPEGEHYPHGQYPSHI